MSELELLHPLLGKTFTHRKILWKVAAIHQRGTPHEWAWIVNQKNKKDQRRLSVSAIKL